MNYHYTSTLQKKERRFCSGSFVSWPSCVWSDGLLIFEAPDDETASTLLLHLGVEGNVHTTTVRAFTAAEMDKLVTKVHVG